MSSASQTGPVSDRIARAVKLNVDLHEFASSGKLKSKFDQQHRILSILSDDIDDRHVSLLRDWFIFDWPGADGYGVLGEYLESHSQLPERDQQMLLEWAESVPGVFRIDKLGQHTVHLHEVDSRVQQVAATTSADRQAELRAGGTIIARLLPAGDLHIFSSKPVAIPDVDSAFEMLQSRDMVAAINTPEAAEQALAAQRDSFVEFFGSDRMTVTLAQLAETMEGFRVHLLAPASGRANEALPAASGILSRDLSLPPIPSHARDLASSEGVTVLFDEFEGLVLLPRYDEFQRVFECDDPDVQMPNWRNLVWDYIKDPEIPLVAFEAVAEVYADQMETVLRTLLEDESFSREHLYALLLHYKDPVAGLEALKDDERLWDLLDGGSKTNGNEKSSTAAGRTEPSPRSSVSSQGSGASQRPSRSKVHGDAGSGRRAGNSAKVHQEKRAKASAPPKNSREKKPTGKSVNTARNHSGSSGKATAAKKPRASSSTRKATGAKKSSSQSKS